MTQIIVFVLGVLVGVIVTEIIEIIRHVRNARRVQEQIAREYFK